MHIIVSYAIITLVGNVENMRLNAHILYFVHFGYTFLSVSEASCRYQVHVHVVP